MLNAAVLLDLISQLEEKGIRPEDIEVYPDWHPNFIPQDHEPAITLMGAAIGNQARDGSGKPYLSLQVKLTPLDEIDCDVCEECGDTLEDGEEVIGPDGSSLCAVCAAEAEDEEDEGEDFKCRYCGQPSDSACVCASCLAKDKR